MPLIPSGSLSKGSGGDWPSEWLLIWYGAYTGCGWRRASEASDIPNPQLKVLRMKLSEFDGVYCLWQLSGKTDKKWSLLKSVVIKKGYCEGERCDEWPFKNLNKLLPHPKYPDDFPMEHTETPIPNRAVTCWCFSDGIRFYGHTCELGDTYYFLMDKLRKLGGWWCPLRDSHALYFGTEAEVRKLLEAVCKTNCESK